MIGIKLLNYELEISIASAAPSKLSPLQIESELSNCFCINLLVVQNLIQILLTDNSQRVKKRLPFC